MDANIRPIKDTETQAALGWLATVSSHEGRVIYAIGNTRDECVENFKRAIVFYSDEENIRRASKLKYPWEVRRR